jgi:HAD superfamily hydrolase (TIGR01549 family)
MKGFQAVLFDLDGTLIYSKGVIGICINETLRHFDIPPFEQEELYELIGVPLGKALSMKSSDIKPLMTYFRELYVKRYLEGTDVYDGMSSILSMLKYEGKLIGVVTLKSTPIAEEVLRGLNLACFVDAVEGDDDVSELKPSPDQIIRVCETLDVKPEDTIMIGDTTMDIIAGKKANCITIGVLWGAMSMDILSEAGVDYLARNPKELENLLKDL